MSGFNPVKTFLKGINNAVSSGSLGLIDPSRKGTFGKGVFGGGRSTSDYSKDTLSTLTGSFFDNRKENEKKRTLGDQERAQTEADATKRASDYLAENPHIPTPETERKSKDRALRARGTALGGKRASQYLADGLAV